MVKASTLLIGAGLAAFAVVTLASSKAEKVSDAGIQIEPGVIATSAEIKEIKAQKTVAGETKPVSQVDIANLRERQITQKFELSEERVMQERLLQQQHNIAKSQYDRFRKTASFKGGKDQDLITTSRREGKIYVYRNGDFIGFQTGEQAESYKTAYFGGNTSTPTVVSQPSRGSRSVNSTTGSVSRSISVSPQRKDSSGMTATDRRVASSSRRTTSRYRAV